MGSAGFSRTGEATVPVLLRRRAAATPDAVALATDAGGQLTFRAWDRRADAVAHGLVARGVRPQDRVALVFDNARWLEYAVGYLGVLRAAAVAVPLGPRFPQLDLVRIIADCAPVGIVGPSDVLPASPCGWRAELPDLETGRSTAELDLHAAPGDPVEMLYGRGAMTLPAPHVFSGADIAVQPAWAATGRGVFLHAFAVGTVAGQQALRLPLGEAPAAALVMTAFRPDRFADLVDDHQVEACGLTPALATALLASGAADHRVVSSVQRVVVAAAPPPVGLLSRLAAALPSATVVGDDGATVGPAAGPGADSPGPAPFVAPVGTSQEGMIWHEQFVPGSFNLSPLLRRLRGPLDVRALEAALDEILRRHGALRSAFSVVDGQAVQRVRPADPLHLGVLDLSRRPAAEQLAALGQLVADARSRPADLVAGPLFRPRLVRLGPEDHVLVIRVHHSVYDDWSVGVFRRELSALYRAFVAGGPSPLPEPPLQFADFCRRQRERLDGEHGAAERSYWARELSGAPLSVQLPIDDPGRPPGSAHAAGQPLSFELPAELVGELRTLARDHRATLFMVMLAGFGVLVHRCTGQDDILVSTLVANRNRTELEGLIGCFGKKLLVRLRLSGDPTFPELVTRTRRAVMGALGHQDLAYEAVVQEMLGPDAAAHGLVPQVGLKFQAAVTATDKLELPGLEISGVKIDIAGARPHFLAGDGDRQVQEDAPAAWGSGLYLGTFLGLSASEDDGGLRLVTDGVFHAPAVLRLLRHFRTLLSAIAASPADPISRLPVLDEDDRAQRQRWNDTGAELPPEPAVHDAFAAQARRTPDRLAVEGGQNVTYAELDRRAEDLATRLRHLGVGPETPVGLCPAPTVDVVVGVLGIWKAGGAYVPLDTADTGRLDPVLADAGIEVVVTGAGSAQILHRRHPKLTLVEPGDVPAPTAVAPRAVAAEPGHLACAFYGTEVDDAGGIQLEHRSLLNLWMAMRSTAHGRSARPSTGLRVGLRAVPTDDGFLRQLVALLGGHTVVTVDDDPTSLVSRLGDGDVDVVDCTPGQLGDLLAAGLNEALARRRDVPTSPVRPVVVLGSSEPVDAGLWKAWRDIEGADAYFVYGPPECSFAATICAAGGSPARATIGTPVVNAGAHVLDDAGRPVPIQVVGELHLEGTILARGHGRVEADAGMPGPDAALPNGRRLATGRLARFLPDGAIELLGRTADQADLRGFRVEPARMEAVLAECPGVADVAVVIQDDASDGARPAADATEPSPLGPAGARLVAFVVPAPTEGSSSPPTLVQLRRFLWSRLPGYASPAAIVAVAALPRRADGRVDRDLLARSPEGVGDDTPDGTTPTAEESFLTSAWAAALGVGEVALDENYWQSFSFLDVLADARQAGVAIPTGNVMRNRTLRNLAADLSAGSGATRRRR